MRSSRRGLIVIVVVAALVAGMVFVDQFIRNRVERSISQTVADEFGGQVAPRHQDAGVETFDPGMLQVVDRG